MMCMISGGNWNNTSNAGLWSMNLNNNRTNSNDNVGVRCADYEAESSRSKTNGRNGVIGMCCPTFWKSFSKFGEICNRIFFLVMSHENQEILFHR